MSVINGAYFRLFSLFLWSIFVVSGTVSSKMCSFFFAESMMTISGLRFVMQSSAGMVPPTVASQPGRSLYTLKFGSTLVTMKLMRLLCRHVLYMHVSVLKIKISVEVRAGGEQREERDWKLNKLTSSIDAIAISKI